MLKIKQRTGMYLLLGVGLYFYHQNLKDVEHFITGSHTWLTLIGSILLFTALLLKKNSTLITGMVFCILGGHFYFLRFYPTGVDYIILYLLILALAHALRKLNSKQKRTFSVIIFLLAVYSLTFSYADLSQMTIRFTLNDLSKNWPILCIILGVYLLFIDKRK